jgi:hypothetical protein
MDPCLYVRYIDSNNYSRISVHVDDLLVTGKGPALFTELQTALGVTFAGYKTQTGNNLSYLGKTIVRDRKNHALRMAQVATIDQLLSKSNMVHCKGASMPYNDKLLVEDDDSPLCDATLYRSIVMSQLYIARMTRPDILFVVTYLASFCSNPTIKHLDDAKRVNRYLQQTKHKSRLFSGTDLTPALSADAAHGLHPDAKGHSGIETLLGQDAIHCQSAKHRANAISSTESEIMTSRDAVTYVPYCCTLFKEMHIPFTEPIVIYQDNLSAIEMVTSGAKFKKAKHIKIATHFIKQFVDSKVIKLVHLPTAEMRADILTKNVSTATFLKFRDTYLD